MRPPLTLASSSPRRCELLARLGLAFDVASPQVDETPRLGEGAEALAQRLAAAKAVAVGARSGVCVLGADTVVALDENIFGKPADAREARMMLARLSGTAHRVITAVAFVQEGAITVATVLTRVWFHPLDAEVCRRYAGSGEARDAAGAYAVQGGAAAFVARIVGSYTNVVGLPLAETVKLLRRAGILA
ncbi:MAG: Maf family protein [Gammaproteobacteria bacterium]